MGDVRAFANTRNRVTPPDKGSFPLDHKGICRAMQEKWANCMKSSAWESSRCRVESAAYLQCRITHNLMNPEEISRLGFSQDEWDKGARIQTEKWFLLPLYIINFFLKIIGVLQLVYLQRDDEIYIQEINVLFEGEIWEWCHHPVQRGEGWFF